MSERAPESCELIARVLLLPIRILDKRQLLMWLGCERTPLRNNDSALARLPCVVPEALPDYCVCCGSYFGLTYGGRLRSACPACKGKPSQVYYNIWHEWQYYTGYPTEYELLKWIKRIGVS